MRSADRSREALLDLDGLTVVLDEAGHVARFSVGQVSRSGFRPHGLSYSLTLHDRSGRRLLGFDNAGRPYEFVDAGRLLEDFWVAVDRMLKSRED